MNNRLSIKDSYKLYKKLSNDPVSMKIYLSITSGYMKFIMSKVLAGVTVVLLGRLGSIAISGRKLKLKLDANGEIEKGFPPNWPETKKLWAENPEAKARKEKIYFLNEHTNNVTFKIRWSKKNILVPNHSLYALQFTRTNKRTTGREIFNGKEYHVNLPKLKKQK